MNKEWVDRKNEERAKERAEVLDGIRSFISGKQFLTEKEIDMMMADVVENSNLAISYLSIHDVLDLRKQVYGDDKAAIVNFAEDLYKCAREVKPLLEKYVSLRYDFDHLLDSDPIEFDGDIVITDPCYFSLRDHNDWEWEVLFEGIDIDRVGFSKYMVRSTLYGDWICGVYKTNTRKKIGSFCADSGMVSVSLLDEVLKYNPSFRYDHWSAAVIKNFKGTVQFVIEETPFMFEGKQCYDYDVHVVGHGVNKKSGKPFNFISTQTGF